MESRKIAKFINFCGNDTTHFSTMLLETVKEDSFTPDMVLKTGPDKKEIYCHRLMLIAASDFLREAIAAGTPGTIPVILLPDVKVAVIDYILMYIYCGEVQVPATHYPDFIDAFRLLMLKGSFEQIEQVQVPENNLVDHGELEGTVEVEDEQISVEDSDVEIMEYNESSVADAAEPEGPSEVVTNQMEQRAVEPSGQKKNKIKIKPKMTPEINELIQTRLSKSVQSAYKRHGATLSANVESNIQDSKLVILDNKLIGATHNCAFCGKSYSINRRVYSKTISFDSDTFYIHLKKNHAPTPSTKKSHRIK